MAISGLCNSEMIQLFDVGMRVKVSDFQTSYLSRRNMDKVSGAYGTVVRVDMHYEKIEVKIDHEQNDLSVSGCFFFKPRELKILDENDNVMEDKNMAISNIKNYTNVARIRFSGETKSCNYLYANFEPDLKVGDLVVVKPAHHDITVATVTEIHEGDHFTVQREIIAKVDTEAYDSRVAVRKQAAELKIKMEERARQLQDVALYKMLAETDPAMMELLKEFQALPQT